jgi:hypothetical protein
MSDIMKQKCLILNKGWLPAGAITVARAIKISCKGNAKIVHPKTLISYTFEEWVEKPVEVEADRRIIRSPRLQFDAPSIIIAIYYNKRFAHKINLTHSNIYKRDGHVCWYCGSDQNLTWDHIKPKSKGGEHRWENLVTCCFSCNNKKGDLDVKEFCEMRSCEVPKPIKVAANPWILQMGRPMEEWLQFVNR